MYGLSTETLVASAAIFIRAGAFVLLMPFAGRPVPIMVRVALAAILLIFTLPAMPAWLPGQMPGHWLGLAGMAVQEAFFGFVLALGVLLVFFVCQVAGNVISQEIGLFQSNLFNPMLNTQESLVGISLHFLCLIMLFAAGLQYDILRAFVRSIEAVPPLRPFTFTSPQYVVTAFGQIFQSSVQIAAPFIALNFIVVLAFGVLGRAAPQINVLILSFAARLLVGLLLLALVMYAIALQIMELLRGTPLRMLEFLQLG